MDDNFSVADDDVEIEDTGGDVNWENASDDLIAVEEPDTSLDESLPPTDVATTEDLSAADTPTEETPSDEEPPSGSYLTGGVESIATTELGFDRRVETGPEMPEREIWGDTIEEEEGGSGNPEMMG